MILVPIVTVEESNTFGVDLEVTEGMRFDKGYISGYFATDTDPPGLPEIKKIRCPLDL